MNVTCSNCAQKFFGALYDDQPNDICFDCYHQQRREFQGLYQKISKPSYSLNSTTLINLLQELETEGYIKLLRKAKNG